MWRWWPAAPTATATAALNRNRNQSTGRAVISDFMRLSFRAGSCEVEVSCDFMGVFLSGGAVGRSDAGVGCGGAGAAPGDQRDDGSGQGNRGGDYEGVVHPGGERGVADAGDLAAELAGVAADLHGGGLQAAGHAGQL